MSTILILDDEPSVRELCAMILGAEGFRIVEAGDAFTGIQVARDHRPALILLDWMLPDSDGMEALRSLKTAGDTCAIPVVMLTALDGLSDVALATLTGADGYLSKPFEPEDLVSLVRRFVDAETRA